MRCWRFVLGWCQLIDEFHIFIFYCWCSIKPIKYIYKNVFSWKSVSILSALLESECISLFTLDRSLIIKYCQRSRIATHWNQHKSCASENINGFRAVDKSFTLFATLRHHCWSSGRGTAISWQSRLPGEYLLLAVDSRQICTCLLIRWTLMSY